LHDKGVLSATDYGRLAGAYQFLRHLEHRLQFDEDRQTHTLPTESESLEQIARRMPTGMTGEMLLKELGSHLDNVIGLYERMIHAGQQEPAEGAEFTPPKLGSVIDQQAPRLAVAVAQTPLAQGQEVLEHFLSRLAGDPPTLAQLDADPALTHTTLDLFGHSPYFGEELIRRPESVLELQHSPEALIHGEPPPLTPAGLRRWYRRGILRIEAQSICRSHPVFDTLALTSDLVDAVIAYAYRIAVEEVQATHPPQASGYHPSDQMFVIALGRLGMREFDLASDADLTFVLADSDAAEINYWTRVAERIVQLIGSYTGEGVLFTVDTRLRPNGSAGPLVQTEIAVLDYFAASAEAWESITYLKARSVAGDPKRAETFLHDLQQVYGLRYGESGSSRVELREMRERLEREQGPARPLKSGRGGYYDIDFLLLYLRLKNAGIYYSYLNTPARIEVLETTEKLSHADAHFLREAATFYRAIDHGLRVLTGLAVDRLPRAGLQLDALEMLLPRWTSVPMSDLERVQNETRSLFDRFFY
jgi:glutamate-ammonia-ligase adenylyltransferase